MHHRLLPLSLLALATASLLAFSLNRKPELATGLENRKVPVSRFAGCGPDWQQLEKYFEETDIPPIPGSGPHKWKINTSSDSAQFYFNQGLNMYYSFHIIEAMASFKKAARLDPESPMLHWAQALAYGPNINDLGYAASPEALAATNRAAALLHNATDKEKQLVAAMKARYSDDSTQSREKLNQDYSNRMKELYERYPGDPDIAALYADAMMLQHPWDLWHINGTPKPWTPQIRAVLEKLLVKFPHHPGANHYYIHVMEPSPFADKALPSADRLGKLTPALSHTVHMPSHIYLRTGHYNKGVNVNEEAVNSYNRILPLYAPVAGNDFLYVIHNRHMQVNNAMLAGRMAYSIKWAAETVKNIPEDYVKAPGALGNYMQAIYMLPMLTDVRFGKWEEALARPAPEKNLVYASVLHHFGRGMAYSQLSRMADAREELARLQEWMKDSTLRLPFTPFSAAIEGAKVAESLLSGNIAMMEKNYSQAIVSFSTAVRTEESMVYTEPRDWLLNPKHFLGKVYLLSGQFEQAEKTYRSDLENNRDNVWALRGLYQALTGQKSRKAVEVLNRFNKAASKVDLRITGSTL